ncbi:MAG: DUF2752 domain-containing protein [Lachnospiraceae bacterium]|nr:DUF2752 domain-containing protein [Lachnospiraceae bacterium]MBR6294528.1 DUF2752 domain-containing protein [Lachnospiraceae bacterium]
MKYCKRRLGNTDEIMYELGLVALGIGLAAVLLYFITGFSVLGIKYPCIFNKVTHLCCPGCGGTRALRALLKGKILMSIYDYPPLIYAVIVYVVFMIKSTLFKFFGIGKPGNGAVVKHLYVFIALILVQWIVKLVAQICFGYYWFM